MSDLITRWRSTAHWCLVEGNGDDATHQALTEAIAEVERLRAAAQQAREALRTCLAALETCTPADYSTGHVIHADYNEKMCAAAENEAPDAMRALDEALGETP